MQCPACDGLRWNSRYERQGWTYVRCGTCRLMRLDPIPTDDQLAEHYAARFASGNYQPEKAAERVPTLEGVWSRLSHLPPGRIFDVGCFDGGLLDLAAADGWATAGLEYQGPAAEIARRAHDVAEGALEDHEPDGTFDVITAIGVIEHLRDPSALTDFARRALTPGGTLLIQTPNLGSLPSAVLGRYWPPIAAPEHIWYFSRRTLDLLLRHTGFTVTDARAHWKPLRIGYAYEQLGVFGPELQRMARPVFRRAPQRVLDATLPMYGGEMIVNARRSAEHDHPTDD